MQVISTFQTAAELGSQSLGAYVISMANTASDVLAVELLQKEALLTVGNTRFISSKSSAQLNTVSPPAAQANSSASTQGQASAPSMVPSTVHGSRSGNLQATTSDTSTISGVLLAPEENFGGGCLGLGRGGAFGVRDRTMWAGGSWHDALLTCCPGNVPCKAVGSS